MMLRKLMSAGLALLGFVFFLQGIGLLVAFESFMNNDLRWAVIGIAMMILGAIFWPRKR